MNTSLIQGRLQLLGVYILALLSAFGYPAAAAPGDLDLTFGGTGRVTTNVTGEGDAAYGVAVQSDGKLVVGGQTSNGGYPDFALVRYNANGSLDSTFNGTGMVTTDLGGPDDQGFCIALQGDGRIIIAGYSGGTFALTRYNSDGSLDTSFNGTGKVRTTVGARAIANSVAVQSDGKIVVAGLSGDASGNHADFAVIRYNANGTLDTSFNGNGIVTTDFGGNNDYGNGLSLQSDGKIVVAGSSYNGSDDDFALVRYNADGSLDTSFNGTGKVTTAIRSADDSGQSVAIQSNGKIVVSGRSGSGNGYDFALARYNADGSLDTSFNGSGKVTTTIGSGTSSGRSVAIGSDETIVVEGYARNISNIDDFALAFYNADGSLDTRYKGTGKVTTDFGGYNDTGLGLVIQSDGMIVVAGLSYSNGTGNDFAVARYQAVPEPASAMLLLGSGAMLVLRRRRA